MKITADTNLLVRAVKADDPRESQLALAELASAETVVLALPALCELVWVLSQGYKTPVAKIARVINGLLNAANVVMDRQAVEAGLLLMAAGADFADGVITYEGQRLGGQTFVSLDKRAVKRLAAQNIPARLLA